MTAAESCALARAERKSLQRERMLVRARQYARLRIIEHKRPQECADELGIPLNTLKVFMWKHKAEVGAARAEAMAEAGGAIAEAAVAMRMELAESASEAVKTVVEVMRGTADKGAKDNARVRAAQVAMERIDPMQKSNVGGQIVNIRDSVILQAAGPLQDFDYDAAGVEPLLEGEVVDAAEEGLGQGYDQSEHSGDGEGWAPAEPGGGGSAEYGWKGQAGEAESDEES